MRQVRIPFWINRPLLIMGLEADFVMIIGVFVYLSWMISYWFTPTVFICPYYYQKVKKQYNRGFLRHALYFLGVEEFKGYPSFFAKRFQS